MNINKVNGDNKISLAHLISVYDKNKLIKIKARKVELCSLKMNLLYLT